MARKVGMVRMVTQLDHQAKGSELSRFPIDMPLQAHRMKRLLQSLSIFKAQHCLKALKALKNKARL
jgi:hypothetical protein